MVFPRVVLFLLKIARDVSRIANEETARGDPAPDLAMSFHEYNASSGAASIAIVDICIRDHKYVA